MKNKKALVVLSGGQDSTTVLFWAKQHFEEVHAITFDYGQRHLIELSAARRIGEMAEVASHEFVAIPDILQSTSPLTSQADLEQYTDYAQMDAVIGERIETTFVPMRNALFLTIAANRAVAIGSLAIVTGICQEDNANYPDCRESFRSVVEDYINLALGNSPFGKNGVTSTWVEVLAPLMNLSKADSAKMARSLPGCWEALAYSHTSYDGKYPPTDMNHANVLRAHGFEEAGLPDPLVLRAHKEGLMDLPETENYKNLQLDLFND